MTANSFIINLWSIPFLICMFLLRPSLSLSQFYFFSVVLLFFFIAFIFVLPLFVRTFCSFVRSATSYQCITILRCIAIRFITWHVNLLLPLPVHSLICSFFNPFDIFDYLFTCSLVLSSPCLIGSFTCWLVCSSLHSFFSSVRSLAPLMLHVCKRRNSFQQWVTQPKLPNVLLDIVRPVLLMRAFSAKTWQTVQTHAQMSNKVILHGASWGLIGVSPGTSAACSKAVLSFPAGWFIKMIRISLPSPW